MALTILLIVKRIWVVIKIMVPFRGTLNIRGRIIIGTQNGTIILTTTPIYTNSNILVLITLLILLLILI